MLSNKKWLIKKRWFENNSTKNTYPHWYMHTHAHVYEPVEKYEKRVFTPFFRFLFLFCSYFSFFAINPFTLMRTHTFFLSNTSLTVFVYKSLCFFVDGAHYIQPWLSRSFFFQIFFYWLARSVSDTHKIKMSIKGWIGAYAIVVVDWCCCVTHTHTIFYASPNRNVYYFNGI